MWRLGSEGRRIPFFAEGRSAVAGMPPPIFSDRHQTKRKKKQKRKEKNQKKRKDLLFIYLFLKDKRIKEYIYIYSCLWGECCPYPCPYPRCLCRFYRRLTCPSTCGFACPYPCPYLCGKCPFYRGLGCPSTCPSIWGCFGDA